MHKPTPASPRNPAAAWPILLLALVTLCGQALAQGGGGNAVPVAMASSVDVHADADAENPYVFKVSDFKFTDMDNDAFSKIQLSAWSAGQGTLREGETVVQPPGRLIDFTAEELNAGSITYYPPPDQSPKAAFATFRYGLFTANNGTSDDAVMTINLVAGPDNATGEPAVQYAGGLTIPTEDSPITATMGTIADTDGIDGVIGWQWSMADTDGGTYTNIQATDATAVGDRSIFTPGDAQVGKYLRICAAFTDMSSSANNERRCLRIADAVANINDAPTGAPVLIYSSSPSVSNLGGTAGSPVTSVPEGIRLGIFRVIKTSEGGVVDADGFPAGQQMFFSYQAGSAAGGWSEFGYDDITRNLPSFFDDSHVALGFMRICMFYTDNGGEVEGGPRTTAAQREQGTICSTPVPITEVSSKPVAEDTNILVPAAATSTSPYTFSAADFRSTDPDAVDDTVLSVQIASLPMAGTLQVDGSDATVDQSVLIADIGDITYWPAASQMATAGYASFTFQVTDDGGTPSPLAVSTTLVADAIGTQSAAATITIDLISSTQAAATGAPTVAASDSMATAHNEDVELTASTSGITEPNGIPVTALRWQWQSAAAPASGTPADGDYSAIAGATAATFTPLQAQVGMYIRVCARFNDGLGNPEGPLCSTGMQVTNVNDAPTSADASVDVFTTFTADAPFFFNTGHFAFMDEDGDELFRITVVNIPESGTLQFLTGDDAVAIVDGQVILQNAIEGLNFYPDDGAEAMNAYATFTFTVGDATASSATHTMTINLVPPGPAEASGMPAITGTATQGQTLTAGTGTVADANGINQATIAWQWQQAAAADSTDWAAIADATAVTFIPTQAQVAQYVRVCMTFMDNHDPATLETPPCSAATGPITDVNDPPMARPENTHNAMRADDGSIAIPVSAFMAAYSDPDGDDPLESVTITVPPPEAEGTLSRGDDQIMIDGTLNVLAITNGEFTNGPLTLTMEEGVQTTTLTFTLSDGEDDSNPATLTITLGSDIEEEQVTQISAILSVAAVTNATTAIGGAISSVPTPTAFDISMDGTSLMGAAQKLGQSKTADSPHQAWYLGTAPQWEHNAAYNASDSSRASLLNRLNAMANGDIALNYSLTDTSTMRFWARYQSLDINGNEGESLEYDGSGSGFYLGADNQITDTPAHRSGNRNRQLRHIH